MIKMVVEVINHNDQRYDTVGDWDFLGRSWQDKLFVKVSRLGNAKMEALVAIHEIVEALLCKARGIREEDVTVFDITHPDDDEPGDNQDAPYHREHLFATKIEKQLAEELGVEWDEYEKAINSLPDWEPRLP